MELCRGHTHGAVGVVGERSSYPESAHKRRWHSEGCELQNLRALLALFGITCYYTDKARVYQRHLPSAQHTVGKLTMQRIERKHLTLRTRLKRLVRKTLCFSRSCVMHDLLFGLYMNHEEFDCPV